MKPNVLIRLLASTAIGAWLLLAHPAIAAAQSPDDLFDPDTLQEIRLTINSRDLQSLRDNFMDNTYYTADLQWRNVRVRNAGVKSRGGASRSGSKLHLRVDFNRYVNGQKFLGLKSIVLKNLWQDGSMMHERLAMAFFARMGQPAPRQSYCRLYIDNQYQGLYAIVESVDNDFLDRNIGEHAGYLYSYEMQEPFHAEYLGEELEPYKLRFEAQNHEKEGDSKLYLPIHDLFKEVNEPDDAIWRERVEQYVDLPQFITQAAIEAFLAENDGLLGAKRHEQLLFLPPPGYDAPSLSSLGQGQFVPRRRLSRSSSGRTTTFSSAVPSPTPICASCTTRCSSRRRDPQPRMTGSGSRSRRRRRRLRPPLKKTR